MVTKRNLQTILIVCALGFLTTACLGGKDFDYHEIDAIADGPGFLTGESGEATLDLKTGSLTMGDGPGVAAGHQRSAEMRRRRARARRRQEGATGG